MSDVALHRSAELALGPTQIPREELLYGWLGQYPPNTQRAYKREFERLEQFLATMGVTPLTARRAHITAWANTLGDVKSSTWNRAVSAASSFYIYAVEEGVTDVNPAKDIRRRKVALDSTDTVWLSREEMRAFLDAARSHSPRAYALFAIMLTTGCRISEVLGSDVTDLTSMGGHKVIRVTRKGGNRQALIIKEWVAAAIEAYLDGRTDGPLIVGPAGRYTPRSAHRLVRTVAAKADLPPGLGNHSLRHSQITDSIRCGVSMRAIQKNAGHATADMTERYAHIAVSLDQSPVHAVAAGLAPSDPSNVEGKP